MPLVLVCVSQFAPSPAGLASRSRRRRIASFIIKPVFIMYSWTRYRITGIPPDCRTEIEIFASLVVSSVSRNTGPISIKVPQKSLLEHIWKELIQLMTIDLETEPSALLVLIRMLTNQIFWGPVRPPCISMKRKRVRLFCVCVCGWPAIEFIDFSSCICIKSP